jgi:hypothetical protein
MELGFYLPGQVISRNMPGRGLSLRFISAVELCLILCGSTADQENSIGIFTTNISLDADIKRIFLSWSTP